MRDEGRERFYVNRRVEIFSLWLRLTRDAGAVLSLLSSVA